MTERPLSHDETELIKTCFWVANQHGMNDEVTERHQAMLDFYLVATPVQAQAIIAEIADADWGTDE